MNTGTLEHTFRIRGLSWNTEWNTCWNTGMVVNTPPRITCFRVLDGIAIPAHSSVRR